MAEKNQEPHKGKQETLIDSNVPLSPYTNKPYQETTGFSHTFWCEVCHKKSRGLLGALMHLSGNAHKNVAGRNLNKISNLNQNPEKETSMRKYTEKKRQTVQSSTEKTEELLNDESLHCKDCDLKFSSAVVAVSHFKGKRHKNSVSMKARREEKYKKKMKIEKLSQRAPMSQYSSRGHSQYPRVRKGDRIPQLGLSAIPFPSNNLSTNNNASLLPRSMLEEIILNLAQSENHLLNQSQDNFFGLRNQDLIDRMALLQHANLYNGIRSRSPSRDNSHEQPGNSFLNCFRGQQLSQSTNASNRFRYGDFSASSSLPSRYSESHNTLKNAGSFWSNSNTYRKDRY